MIEMDGTSKKKKCAQIVTKTLQESHQFAHPKKIQKWQET